jgi:hypothetical protein
MALSSCMRKSDYRKIYEAHHGPIPKDDQGRSYEIHHIDNNHNNNSIHNLKLVTIDEHYAIHKAQGDYVSAFMIAQRMKLSPEELSDIASKSVTLTNQRRIEAGTHNFQDSKAARQRNIKRVNDGTHNLLGDANPSTVLAKAGKHHFQLNNPTHKKIESGTHPFQVNHQNKIQVTCLCCKKTGGLVNMNRYHLANCKAAKILSAE